MTRGSILLILCLLLGGLIWFLASAMCREMTADVTQANRIHAQALQEAE